MGLYERQHGRTIGKKVPNRRITNRLKKRGKDRKKARLDHYRRGGSMTARSIKATAQKPLCYH